MGKIGVINIVNCSSIPKRFLMGRESIRRYSIQNVVKKLGYRVLRSNVYLSHSSYVYYAHTDKSRNACHLASGLFQALFSASLAHPSAYHSYATYDIGHDQPITKLVPGLDLFTDDHRVHCANLLDCCVWLSEHLVHFQCYLQVRTWPKTLKHHCQHPKHCQCLKKSYEKNIPTLRASYTDAGTHWNKYI